MIERAENTRVVENKPEKPETLITPSEEWAWMLGVLSARGLDPSYGFVSLESERRPELVDKFKTVGEILFHAKIVDDPPPSENARNVITFYNTDIVSAIGNLQENNFSDTIRNRHAWVIADPAFTWQFLTGYFDRKGHSKKPPRRGPIFLYNSYAKNVDFLIDILQSVDVQAKPDYGGVGRTLRGVKITKRNDIQQFANNVQSCVPELDTILAHIKDSQPKTLPLIEIVRQWLIAYRMNNGPIPSVKTFEAFHKNGTITYSTATLLRYGGGKIEAGKNMLNGIGSFISPYLDTQLRMHPRTEELHAAAFLVREITDRGKMEYNALMRKAGTTIGELGILLYKLQHAPEEVFHGRFAENDVRRIYNDILATFHDTANAVRAGNLEEKLEALRSKINFYSQGHNLHSAAYVENAFMPQDQELWNIAIQQGVLDMLISTGQLTPEDADTLSDFFEGNIIRSTMRAELLDILSVGVAKYQKS